MQNDDAEVLERLLKQAGPILAGINAPERKLSPAELEEIMGMLAKTVPPLGELTDTEMKMEVLKLLTRQIPMEATEIVAALRKDSHAPKDGDWSVVHALLLEFERAGFVRANDKPTEPNISQYTITDKGSAQLHELIRKSGDPETSCGGALRPSPATE